MNRVHLVLAALVSLSLSLALATAADPAPPKAAPPKPAPKPKPDHSAAVAAAVEKCEAVAKPKKPRKVLLYSHCNGFNHGTSIAVGAIAWPALAKKTGAFEVVVSDDLAYFEADKIKDFDAIIFNNTTGELFTGKAFDKSTNKPAGKEEEAKATERLRKNLVDFVKGGKGIVGIHSATDCSYGWAEWGQMMGGYFGGHPYSKITVRVNDPKHPVNQAFKGQDFEYADEIYVYKDPYSRDRLRVLLSIDNEKSRINTAAGKRKDADYALGWVNKYGQGRVFYCAFGHDQRAWCHPMILQHFLDGLQFALGDLEGDTTPSNEVGQKAPPAPEGAAPPPAKPK